MASEEDQTDARIRLLDIHSNHHFLKKCLDIKKVVAQVTLVVAHTSRTVQQEGQIDGASPSCKTKSRIKYSNQCV